MLSDSETSLVQRSTTLLVDLPPELLTAICVFVDCQMVVWCRLVCRRLRDVIDASLELQYRIELVRDGMIDQGASVAPESHTRHDARQLTTSERLARLRQLREAWTTLSWTRCVTVPMPGPCCAYELVGGVFCKTQPRGRGMSVAQAHGLGFGGGFWNGGFAPGHVAWDHGHGTHWNDEHGEIAGGGGDGDGEDFGSRTMSVTSLPGRLGLGESDRERTVVRDDLGIPTRDFAMDPSQDLMVLFRGDTDDAWIMPPLNVFPGTIELHVRTMSSNQTHPKARVPVLCSPVLYPITNVFVQIADDVVGIMHCINSTQPRITIWNWRTGSLVVDRGSGNLGNLNPGTWDFAFINSRALFLTTTNGGGTLELYTFTCDPADSQADPSATSSQSELAFPLPISRPTSALTHVATLSLPAVHTSVRVVDVSTHAGPFLAGCPPDKPFMASNEERIHVLTIQYVHLPTLAGPRTLVRTCVFVYNRVLAAYLNRADGVRAGLMGALGVSWSDWGQKHARMMTYAGVFHWLRYVHGQRVVLLHPSLDTSKNTIHVLDFNVRRAFREDTVDANASIRAEHIDEQARDSSKNGDAITEVVDYPTRIVMPSIFTGVVESGLPYHDVRRDVCGEYSGVMIDDERLVGLKQYPVFMMGDLKEIDVFTM